MATMLSVNTGADATTTPLTFDNPRGRAAAAAPVRLRRDAGGQRPAVLKGSRCRSRPAAAGFGLDMPRLLSDMDYVASQPGLRQVVVPLTALEPTITTDDLTALGIDGLGSQFTTYFDPDNKAAYAEHHAGREARRRHRDQARRRLLAERHAWGRAP